MTPEIPGSPGSRTLFPLTSLNTSASYRRTSLAEGIAGRISIHGEMNGADEVVSDAAARIARGIQPVCIGCGLNRFRDRVSRAFGVSRSMKTGSCRLRRSSQHD